MTAQEMLEMAQDERKDSSADTCRIVGDDTVAGETATLYSVHPTNGGVDSFTLPDGSSMDVQTDYTNVQPPPGVK
jgi:hypothetical protein